MATKTFEEIDEVVEVQTHVVVVLPPSTPGGVPGVVEGFTTVAQAQAFLDSPGAFLKVVTEWVCPECGRVHGDQLDLAGPCE